MRNRPSGAGLAEPNTLHNPGPDPAKNRLLHGVKTQVFERRVGNVKSDNSKPKPAKVASHGASPGKQLQEDLLLVLLRLSFGNLKHRSEM